MIFILIKSKNAVFILRHMNISVSVEVFILQILLLLQGY